MGGGTSEIVLLALLGEKRYSFPDAAIRKVDVSSVAKCVKISKISSTAPLIILVSVDEIRGARTHFATPARLGNGKKSPRFVDLGLV